MAKPMLEASRRWGSRVEFSATTAKVTSPGYRYFTPSLRETSLQCGGKMEETRTRFCAAMPASLNASSNEVRRSLCLPTPLVRKMRFGTMFMPNVVVLHGIADLMEPQKITPARGRARRISGKFFGAARVERPGPAAALVVRQQGRFRQGQDCEEL